MQQNWRGGRAFLLAQRVRLVEQFIRSDRISITPALFLRDDLKRRLIITLNMTKVVQHIGEAIRFETPRAWNRCSTGTGLSVPPAIWGYVWYTGRPCARAARSHINFCVYDGTWEASEAFALDHAPQRWPPGRKTNTSASRCSTSIAAWCESIVLTSSSGSSRMTCWCWKPRDGTANKTEPSAGSSTNG